eukprot:CAMPEP_0181179516 /NCGR_PEP_ID=MMETSP1096-20121128/6304_1 /TAXON_ID=156174 ORGANISM="Chrysochromulina ericina, Strain CCMP281" /NCGR_SAMPLE_ID=MMETSP1096 /ASSEMBLY_ACC=CAM_ASM_000453 /LENGTH=164 /DNA_ID=CAMNT_0023267875 /DNA_START=486 /DNA_END=977 /DNA_ORIENTATION=-
MVPGHFPHGECLTRAGARGKLVEDRRSLDHGVADVDAHDPMLAACLSQFHETEGKPPSCSASGHALRKQGHNKRHEDKHVQPTALLRQRRRHVPQQPKPWEAPFGIGGTTSSLEVRLNAFPFTVALYSLRQLEDPGQLLAPDRIPAEAKVAVPAAAEALAKALP